MIDPLEDILINWRKSASGCGEQTGARSPALFVGPTGTGKTMAARAIARELDLELLRVDLNTVVSKYIGATEKALDRIFADSERNGAVLLIGEADALLLPKRSNVLDPHDRNANIEVGYLLQRIEDFSGLVILTTNSREEIEAALLRRMRFVLNFPLEPRS